MRKLSFAVPFGTADSLIGGDLLSKHFLVGPQENDSDMALAPAGRNNKTATTANPITRFISAPSFMIHWQNRHRILAPVTAGVNEWVSQGQKTPELFAITGVFLKSGPRAFPYGREVP